MITINNCDEIRIAFHMQHVYSFYFPVWFSHYCFHLSELSIFDMGVQRVQSYFFNYKQQNSGIFFCWIFFIPFLSQDVKGIS